LAAIVVKLDPDMIAPGLMIALIAGALPTDQPTPLEGEPRVARRSPGRPVSTADLNQQLLALHNRPRDEVGVPPLSWSPALAAQARVWAETLITGRRFEHDDARGLVGENLWAGWGRRFSPEEMVEAWTEERSAYVHGVYPHVRRPGDATVVGHYTQMIWRNTTEVGCAVAERDDRQVLVCRYSPPGNVRGEMAY